VYRNDFPYNELPLLPPPLELLESRQVAAKLNLASRALAEVKGLTVSLPNPLILIQTLVLQEAQQSSQIENILTTHDELYRALAAPDDHTSPETKEVLRYREAMTQGLDWLKTRPLSTNLILELQAILIGNSAGIRKQPGTVIRNARTAETIYTPPEGERMIRDCLANLEIYLHSDDNEQDPLVRMAVAHYQFEAIHPFYDGNGRTGRLINILYLMEQGLLSQPVLYLSAYFLRERSSYYTLLKAVTEQQAWADWVVFVLTGIEQTAKASSGKIGEMREAMDSLEDRIRQKLPAVRSKDLLAILFQAPYAKINYVADALDVSYHTARSYLKKLAEHDLVEERKLGRENYYLNTTLLDLLRLPLLP
jgi:Fic family protein